MKKKPADCPLFQHANGQWAKKVLGKLHYFGKDLDEALGRWADERDYLLAGKPVKRNDTRPTLVELGNLYADKCKARILDGEMVQRSFDESKKTIDKMISLLGENCRPEDLDALDFSKLKQSLFEPIERTKAIRGGVKGISVERRSPVTVAGDVRRVRAFLNWCSDTNLIAPCRWAKEFQPITAKQSRKSRVQSSRKLLAPADVRSIIDSASVGLKPLILLGINAGLGAADLANWTMEDLPNLKGDVWIDTSRGKTEAPRRFVLWPQTRDAIVAWLAVRPEPFPEARDRVFVTKEGVAWVRGETDAVSKAFLKTRKDAGVKRGTFYDLRRAFQTIGAQTKEYRACSFIMGHVVEERDMSGRYTVDIPDKTIKKVCDHVRKWLFGGAK